MNSTHKNIITPPCSFFTTQLNILGIYSLLLGFFIILQSCSPVHELTPEAKKSELLLKAQNLFKKQVSARKAASNNPRDIDISKLFPQWNVNRIVKNDKELDILQVFIKKNNDQTWTLDFLEENNIGHLVLRKYTKHDGCLTIYDGDGRFLEKGNYNSEKSTYARFLTRETLTKQARISSQVEYIRDGDEWIVLWWEDSDGDGIDNAHSTRIPVGSSPIDNGGIPPPPGTPNGSNPGGGSSSGGGVGTSPSSPPPCVDADGCGCEDEECKKAKAIQKIKEQVNNELNQFVSSIEFDPILDENGVRTSSLNSNKASRTSTEVKQDIFMPFSLGKSASIWDFEFKTTAIGSATKTDGKIVWIVDSFETDKAENLRIEGEQKVFLAQVKMFNIKQQNNSDDTQMRLRFIGNVEFSPQQTVYSVGNGFFSGEVEYKPVQQKSVDLTRGPFLASKYYKPW